VALVVTFATGVVLGVVAAHVILLHGGPPGPRSAAFLVKRLDRRLDLTPQQEAEVTRIIQRGHTRISAVWSNVHPQIRVEIDRTNDEIDRVLTPAQRAKFAEIKMKMAPRRLEPGLRFRHD
jgi:hypothetical protein